MTERTEPGLFQGTAWYYARFRPGYPPDLIDLIAARFGGHAEARALDLGTGTGQLAIPLAEHFAEIVAVDPEPAMLAAASAAAVHAGVSNVRFVAGSSRTLADLSAGYGHFDVVTMGSSFHWMDRDATLRALDRMVRPGGGVVLAGNGGIVWNGGEPWHAAARTVIQRWLGEDRRAGGGVYVNPEPAERHEVVLARSPFAAFEEYHWSVRRHHTLDQLCGLLSSTSFASPTLLGEQRPAFEADLRQTLEPLLVKGRLTEVVDVEAFLAWRGERRDR
ncbi:MAG TPA: class I SAM-dependent methyltransferase [Thermomicrobiaceae bacterium]|nr:class I SAM-dependent methyltransferase [Thermomicrobiaceae bacterium]